MKERNKELKELPADYYDVGDSDNACFLCENPRFRLVYEVTHFGFPFRFQRCGCGLIKQTPMPNVKFFDWFFNSDVFFSAKQTNNPEIWGFYDYFTDEPSRMATSVRRYKELGSIFESGKRLDIMKIGPSTGTFLHVAQQRGHRVRGCDVSSTFVHYAKERYNVTIDNGRFEHMQYAEGQFDVILLFNVIENIPNQVEFLRAVHRTLRPGGYFISNFVDMHRNMIAAVQRSQYFIYRPPICYVFTGDTYRRTMEKFGFSVRRMLHDRRYMTLEKISTLLRWRWLLRFASLLGVEKKPFSLYAYPSKLVVAQKTEQAG